MDSMSVFISHNAAELETARLLAVKLVERGVSVWFDEWRLRPGDSITGGIETGIAQCDTFVILWSASAQQSRWVGTELRAALRRRVEDASLRVIPIMADDTPLPVLVADYKGFVLKTLEDLEYIANEIAGHSDVADVAHRLQRRLLELAVGECPEDDAVRARFCPRCASDRLSARIVQDPDFDDQYYEITCDGCHWVHRAKMPETKGVSRVRRH